MWQDFNDIFRSVACLSSQQNDNRPKLGYIPHTPNVTKLPVA